MRQRDRPSLPCRLRVAAHRRVSLAQLEHARDIAYCTNRATACRLSVRCLPSMVGPRRQAGSRHHLGPVTERRRGRASDRPCPGNRRDAGFSRAAVGRQLAKPRHLAATRESRRLSVVLFRPDCPPDPVDGPGASDWPPLCSRQDARSRPGRQPSRSREGVFGPGAMSGCARGTGRAEPSARRAGPRAVSPDGICASDRAQPTRITQGCGVCGTVSAERLEPCMTFPGPDPREPTLDGGSLRCPGRRRRRGSHKHRPGTSPAFQPPIA